MAANHHVVSLRLSSGTLELLCYQDSVIKWRENKNISLDKVLVSRTIYSDAKQGERASEAAIKEAGNSENEAILEILTRGHVALSTQERRKRVEEKKQEIAGFIHNNYLNSNNVIVPITQITAAMDNIAGLKIDPFAEACEQAPKIVETFEKKNILSLHPGGIEGSLMVPCSVCSKIQAAAAKIGVQFTDDGDYSAKGWSVKFSVSPKGIDQLMHLLETVCKGEYECNLLNAMPANDVQAVESKGKKNKGKDKKGK